MIDIGMVSYALTEGKNNIEIAKRWLRSTIRTLEEAGATEAAGEFNIILQDLNNLAPFDGPLTSLKNVYAKHKESLETASRTIRARKIVASLTNLPIDETNRTITEENIVRVLSELDKQH